MIDQLGIALCGATAVWLTQSTKKSQQRWACVFGIVGQPFWFYATYTAQQWGMFAVTFLYTIAWIRGVYNHWIKEWFEWN